MRKYMPAIIILIFLSISCSSPEESAFRLYEKGVQSINAGNSEGALEIFDSILEEYPEQPYGHFGKAVYYAKEGLIYKAMDACHKVSVEHPKFLPGLLLNSKLCLKINRPELSFYYITQYLNSGGDLSTGIALEVASLLQAGKVDDAVNSAQRGLDELPDNPLMHVIRGQCYLHEGEFEKGLNECAFASSKADGMSEVYESLGDSYKLLGLYDSSAFYYEKALETAGDDLYYKSDIAEKFIELEYFPRARALLKEFKARVPDSHRYYFLSADIFDREDRVRRAMHEYGMIIQKYNFAPFVLCRFAEYKAKIRDKIGSQQYHETAQIFVEQGKYPEAVVFDVNLRYLEMLIDAFRVDMAGPVMEDILNALPNNFRALHSATTLYWARDAEVELKKVINKMQEVAVGNPANMARMGRLFVKIDLLDSGQKVILDVLDIDKLNRDAILGQIELLEKQRRPAEAIAFLNSRDEYLSYHPETARKKLELYQELGEVDAAFQFAEQLISIGPGCIERYSEAIELADKLGYGDAVREISLQCVENNPQITDAILLYARYLFESKDYAGAEENVLKALSSDSLHIGSLTLLGHLLAANGDSDSAIVIYEKVIGLDQYASDALGSLALLLVENNIKLQFALNYANKAIYYDPSNAKLRNTLARVHHAMEKYATASVSFKHALRFAPEDPEINYYAGKNYIKDNKPDAARMCLKKAINNGLGGELKADAEKALRQL
jgi:tetratricopeptide (TPR) repeat protein